MMTEEEQSLVADPKPESGQEVEEGAEPSSEPAEAPSAEEVAAWLEAQGYRVAPPEAPAEVPEADPYRELEEAFQEAYASETDDSTRAALVVEFNRRMRALDGEAEAERRQSMEQVQAYIEGQAHLPEVVEQFEAHGLPRAAAADFVALMSQCPAEARAQTNVQLALLQRAVGSAVLSGLSKGVSDLPMPRGESPAGAGAAPIEGVSPEVVASIRQNFPQLGPLTPAKIAKLKREGIF